MHVNQSNPVKPDGFVVNQVTQMGLYNPVGFVKLHPFVPFIDFFYYLMCYNMVV